jgi:hypothetical protein
MKYFNIIALLLSISTVSFGQQIKMQIQLTDGSNEFYSTGDIDSVTFVHHSSEWSYHRMKVFSNFVLHTDGSYETEFPAAGRTIYGPLYGGFNFSGDTLKVRINSYDGEIYPLVSQSPSMHFDSITVAEYALDSSISRLHDSLSGSINTHCLPFDRNSSYKCLCWQDSTISYMGYSGFGSLTVDKNSVVIGDTGFCPEHYAGDWFEHDANSDKFLTIHPRFYDPIIKAGSLIQYTPQLGDEVLLANIDSNISRGVYYKSGSIIYYSYGPSFSGTSLGSDAGFYLYEPSTNSTTFLLSFASELGTDETVSGFDISPDKTTLLIPVCSKTKAPFLIEFSLFTKQKDTLRFNEFLGFKSLCFWAQYSHDGKQILYNFFTPQIYGYPSYAASSTGIIDRSSLAVTKLNLEPDTQSPWVSMFPRWSPTDNHIGFISSRLIYSPLDGFHPSGEIFVVKLH